MATKTATPWVTGDARRGAERPAALGRQAVRLDRAAAREREGRAARALRLLDRWERRAAGRSRCARVTSSVLVEGLARCPQLAETLGFRRHEGGRQREDVADIGIPSPTRAGRGRRRGVALRARAAQQVAPRSVADRRRVLRPRRIVARGPVRRALAGSVRRRPSRAADRRRARMRHQAHDVAIAR